jgi:hypothetical protein
MLISITMQNSTVYTRVMKRESNEPHFMKDGLTELSDMHNSKRVEGSQLSQQFAGTSHNRLK